MASMPTASKYELFQSALTEARQHKGFTQAEVALRLGKPQSFVSKYESGERRLDVIEFLEVCEALSISPHDILRTVSTQNG